MLINQVLIYQVLIKEKRIGHRVDFAVQATLKVNESEMLDKYLDFAWELKKLWNIKRTMRLIVVGTFETVSSDLERNWII